MKVKNIRIAIKTREDMFEEIKEVWKDAEAGKKMKKREGVYFQNLDVMRKVLTEERLRILKTIKLKHPSSIYDLAKVLERDLKNTYDDVQFLSEMGFIELKKTSLGRERSIPTVNYDGILLDIPLTADSVH